MHFHNISKLRVSKGLFFLFIVVSICKLYSCNFKQPTQAIDTVQTARKLNTPKKFIYPTINKYGKTLDDFSPNNWEITDTTSGDLNKDGIKDFALVVKCKDSIKINDDYRFPRLLLLVFKVGDHYELKLQHNTLIECEQMDQSGATGGWDGDFFDSMEIVNGILTLHFKWDIRGVGNLIQYVVRYQSDDFYLIGATNTNGYHSDEKISDFNFLTKRYTIDETDDERGFGGEYTEYHKKGKLPANTLKKLIDIEGPNDIPGSEIIQ